MAHPPDTGAPDRLAALRAALAALVESNPFQRRRLASLPGGPLPESLEDFAARFPLTTKAELAADQAAHPPYGSNLTDPLARYTRCHQTSGTSGPPLRWLDTPESWAVLRRDWMEVFRQAGVGSGDRILFAFSFGPFLGFWLAFEAAQELGALVIAGGGMGSLLRARVLVENACTVLCCTPTYALHLARTARQEGVDLSRSRLRRLLVAGEPGGSLPAVQARLAEAWNGARSFDHHGMTEVGPATHEDPLQPGRLVVLEDSLLAEVVDPATGQPVAPGPDGATGELVLTTLRRLASPVVRYRTGDLVRARRHDGRLVLEGGILGRVDDMVVVRGVNVYPSAIDALVREIPGVGEYRVTLDLRAALPELTVEVEAGPGDARLLAEHFRRQLALRIPVTAVPGGSLPAFEMKASRWRRIS